MTAAWAVFTALWHIFVLVCNGVALWGLATGRLRWVDKKKRKP